MKKIIIVLLVFTFLFSVAAPVMAAKPTALPEKANARAKINYQNMLVKQEAKGHIEPIDNGIEEYSFYLSGDIMPVPQYGGQDIIGSEVDSKLLVNQPNGTPVALVTGNLKGLDEGSYIAYLAKGYTETVEQWNMVGEYDYDFIVDGETYSHKLTILTQENGDLTGTGSHLKETDTVLETVTGKIIGNEVTLHIEYDQINPYSFDAILTIDENGELSGSSPQYTGTGDEIVFTSVMAVIEEVIVTATTYPGDLTATIEKITFEVDAEGNGSFSFVILPEDVEFVNGFISFSVWINHIDTTILISETVQLAE